jgi:chloramphenicol-sensitive protein RarD
MNASTNERHGGVLYGLAAYAMWGVLPLYFSLVTPFAKPLELLAHRLLWGLLLLSLALTAAGRWRPALATLRDRRTRWLLLLSALLVGTNWFVFLYGVSSGKVVETSMGYFLTPLVSIVLGLVVFRERLRPAAKAGLAMSFAGIAYLVFALGTLPWMAITVAFSFGLYGMVRKMARVDGLTGLFVETLILAPAAAVYLLVQASSGSGAVIAGRPSVIALLIFSGILTAVPMVCYGEATRRLKLSTLGFLQYVLPTLQLLAAVTLLGEPFRSEQQVCFALIWTALALIAVDSVLSQFSLRRDRDLEPRPTAKAVRADWHARLPGWVQPFLTWLIAFPYPGKKPLVPNRPW